MSRLLTWWRPISALGASFAVTGVGAAGTIGLGIFLQRRAARGSHQQPPYVMPAEVTAEAPGLRQQHGQKLFLKNCAVCHGADATGDDGPDLHGLWISERGVATVIKRGIKGEMPSFAKKRNDWEIAEIVAYVKSLR